VRRVTAKGIEFTEFWRKVSQYNLQAQPTEPNGKPDGEHSLSVKRSEAKPE